MAVCVRLHEEFVETKSKLSEADSNSRVSGRFLKDNSLYFFEWFFYLSYVGESLNNHAFYCVLLEARVNW